MIINWDTTQSPNKFPEKIKKIFLKQTFLQRKKYNKWIGLISHNEKNNIDWWSSNPTTRNPHISKIFKLICILETLRKIDFAKNNYNLVVESDVFKTIISNFFNKKKRKNKIKIKRNSKILINCVNFCKTILFNFTIFFIINLFYKKRYLSNINLLINTYPTLDTSKPERLFRLKKFKKKTFFVPTFIVTRKIFKFWNILNLLEKKNYLFKEHYLSLEDYIFSILHFFRTKRLIGKFENYNSFDLSPQINEELFSLSNSSSRFNCILNFCFLKKLSKKGIKLKKSLVWLENQPDKVWSYAINKYFPNIQNVGYQGFSDIPQLMNSIPSFYESNYGFLPKKIITIGKAYKKSRCEFFKNLKPIVGPAQVYSDALNTKKKFLKTNKFLVILSDFEEINKNLLEILLKNKSVFENLELIIKLPKNKNKSDFKFSNFFPENFKFTSSNLQNLMKKTESVICAEITGSILESIIYNCYIVIPNINISNYYHLNKVGIPSNRYKAISTDKEFKKTILSLKNKKLKLLYPTKLVNQLFNKPNKFNLNLLSY